MLMIQHFWDTTLSTGKQLPTFCRGLVPLSLASEKSMMQIKIPGVGDHKN